MKKTKLLPLMFILFFLALSTLIFLNVNATTIKTTVKASSLDDVQVDQVDHIIRILDGGTVAISDTIKLSAKQNTTLTEYSLGFPYKYQQRLAYCYAFNTANSSETFDVLLDTGLEQIGYYGAKVIFPQGGIQLRSGESFSFTMVFVFSNIISSSTTTYLTDEIPPRNVTEPVLTVDFPIYPSLPQNASLCNITILCVPKTSFAGSSPSFPRYPTIKGTVETGQILNVTKHSLEKLASVTAWMNFTSEENIYKVATVDELERHVKIDGWNNIFVTDKYKITSYMQQLLTGVRVRLPEGAYSVSAWDAKGKAISAGLADQNTTTYSISFGFSLQQGQTAQFKLTYYLPSSKYLNEVGMGNFDLIFPTSKSFSRVAGKLTLRVSLAEGASIKEFKVNNVKEYNLQKGALQEEILFTAYNVSLYNNLDINIAYVYSVFWTSFRPTLWITAIVAVGCIIVLLWQAPKPLTSMPTLGATAKPQNLRAIISSYEEKTKIQREIESLERQARKGRIPRRRYKVRRRMLESKLSSLNRELVDLKQKVKHAGPKYADLLRQLEIAEAELEGVKAELQRVEARYRRGELSLEAYKRLQDDYNKRKERAKTTIESALLRLSEGIA